MKRQKKQKKTKQKRSFHKVSNMRSKNTTTLRNCIIWHLCIDSQDLQLTWKRWSLQKAVSKPFTHGPARKKSSKRRRFSNRWSSHRWCLALCLTNWLVWTVSRLVKSLSSPSRAACVSSLPWPSVLHRPNTSETPSVSFSCITLSMMSPRPLAATCSVIRLSGASRKLLSPCFTPHVSRCSSSGK